MFNAELVKMNAYLPVKLGELSKLNEKAAVQLLQEWGEGTKPIKILWKEACEALSTLATQK